MKAPRAKNNTPSNSPSPKPFFRKSESDLSFTAREEEAKPFFTPSPIRAKFKTDKEDNLLKTPPNLQRRKKSTPKRPRIKTNFADKPNARQNTIDRFEPHIKWIESLNQNDLKGQIDQEFSDTAFEKRLVNRNKEYRVLKTALAKAKRAKKKDPQKIQDFELATAEKRAEIAPGFEAKGVKATGKTESLFPEVESTVISRDLGKKIARINFMSAMTGILGSIQKVKNHFRAVRRVTKIPDQNHLYLAKEAATRLEAAYENFKARFPDAKFPTTSVGQSLRGRHQNRYGKGMLSHPLGYAIDYDAYNNPYLKNSKRLIEVVTGGTAQLTFRDKKGGRLRGLQSIFAEIGKETMAYEMKRKADPSLPLQMDPNSRSSKGRLVLNQFDQAHAVMHKTSEDFKKSIPQSSIEELERLAKEAFWGKLRNEYNALRKSIPRLEKQVKKIDQDAVKAIKKLRKSAFEKSKGELKRELRTNKKAASTKEEQQRLIDKFAKEIKGLEAHRDRDIEQSEMQTQYDKDAIKSIKRSKESTFRRDSAALKREIKEKRRETVKKVKQEWVTKLSQGKIELEKVRDQSIKPEEIKKYFDEKSTPENKRSGNSAIGRAEGAIKRERSRAYRSGWSALKAERENAVKLVNQEWDSKQTKGIEELKEVRDQTIEQDEIQKYYDQKSIVTIKGVRKKTYRRDWEALKRQNQAQRKDAVKKEERAWAAKLSQGKLELQKMRDKIIEQKEIDEYFDEKSIPANKRSGQTAIGKAERAIKRKRRSAYSSSWTTLKTENRAQKRSAVQRLKEDWTKKLLQDKMVLEAARDKTIEPEEIKQFPSTPMGKLALQKNRLQEIRDQFRPSIEGLLQPYFEKIAAKKASLMKPFSGKSLEDLEKKEQQKMKNALSEVQEFENLEWRLRNDLNFVFGNPKKKKKSDELWLGETDNPSVLQLLNRGFFQNNQDPDGNGFNQEFFRVMIEHGFEPGATWGSVDSMHFNFAEGLVKLFPKSDNIKSTGPEGPSVLSKQRYSGQKRIEERERKAAERKAATERKKTQTK